MANCWRLFAAGLLLFAGFSTTGAAESARTPIEIRKAVTAGLAAESSAKTSEDRVAAIRTLAALSKEIAAHTTLAPSAAQDFQARIAARLERARREIEERQAQAKKHAKAAGKQKAAQSVAPRDEPILAQFPGGNGPGVAEAGEEDGAEVLAELIEDIIAPGAWEKNGGNGAIRVFGQAAGGQAAGGNADVLAQVAGGGNRGAGPAPLALTENVGEELVALIQEVIAPQTWEANGGAGAAIFVPGRNVLVVRNTEEVHEAIFDVVGKLRRE